MRSISLRPAAVTSRLIELLAEHGLSLRSSRVLVLGITYKPNIADVRESPALDVLADLEAAGADVSFRDVLVPQVVINGLSRHSVQDATKRFDAIVLMSDHANEHPGWLDSAPVVLDTTYRSGHRAAVPL